MRKIDNSAGMQAPRITTKRRRFAVPALLLLSMLSGCAQRFAAADFGTHTFRGRWDKDSGIGMVDVWGKPYAARLLPGETGEVLFTSEQGEPIACNATRFMDSAYGTCLLHGGQSYRFASFRRYAGSDAGFYLMEEGKYKSHNGSFSILTRQITLNVDGVPYTGKVEGALFGDALRRDVVLRSPDGESLPCLTFVSVGLGWLSCSPFDGVTYQFHRSSGHF